MPSQSPSNDQNNNLPPEVQYRQPGAFDHGVKRYFQLHHMVGYALIGMIFLAIVAVAYWYQVSHSAPQIETQTPVVHQDPTADWKTYTSDQYGFEFSYPQNWELKNGSDYVIADVSSPETVQTLKNCFEGCGPDIEIRHYSDITKEPENSGNNLNATTLDDYVKKNPMISDAKKIIFAGYPAYEMTRGGFGAYFSIMIDKNSQIYEIFFYNQSKKSALTSLENQIIYSFDFISDVDITTWLKYENKDLGIRFSYPPKFKNLRFVLKTKENFGSGSTPPYNTDVTNGKKFFGQYDWENYGNIVYLFTGISSDFGSNREGDFTDNQGYVKENGKYYFKYIQDSKFEFDQKYVSEIKGVNTTGIFIEPKPFPEDDKYWFQPYVNTFAAIFNLKSSKEFKGIEFQYVVGNAQNDPSLLDKERPVFKKMMESVEIY